jgi:hypothetical protein
MVLTSWTNAWKQIFIFPLRYYANCVSNMPTVLITLKVSISFIVTSYPRCNYIILPFISRTLHVLGIHHAHHQEYITVSAVVAMTYDLWIMKCSVWMLHFLIQRSYVTPTNANAVMYSWWWAWWMHETCKAKSNPITGLDRPWGFQEFEAPRF